MSANDWNIEPPPFAAPEALVALKRQLRALRPLAENSHRFTLRGVSVIELSATAQQIDARLAQRPLASPQWTTHSLRSSADLRRFIDTVRQRLRRWDTED